MTGKCVLDFSFFDLADTSHPNLVDRWSGKLAVCGSGRTLWDDLERLKIRLYTEQDGWDVMVVNDVVQHMPRRIMHFYSNDRTMLEAWMAARRPMLRKRWGQPEYVHTCKSGPRIAYKWPWPAHGSSGLGAVYCALAMGYDPVVLCGVPLDDDGHYFDPPGEHTAFTQEVGTTVDGDLMYWAKAQSKLFHGRVFSMSGRTRELLGEPRGIW